jgi:23S rRNA (guanosine2251-2'-O)-methyltransferase
MMPFVHTSHFPVCLLLHNIRSTHNVGSILRTADAAAVSKVYLTGYTPTPFDRFGRPRKDVAKTALGAELSVPWEYAKTASGVIKKLKKGDVEIIALEQSAASVDYKDIKIDKPTLIILGNEPKGISKSLLKHVDIIAEIPMKGQKESLNVSVAAGVFLFRVLQI